MPKPYPLVHSLTDNVVFLDTGRGIIEYVDLGHWGCYGGSAIYWVILDKLFNISIP